MNAKVKSYLFPSLITLAFLAVYYYLALPAINLRSGGFWFMIILASLAFFVSFGFFRNSDFFKQVGAWLKSVAEEDSKKKNKKNKNAGDIVIGNDAATAMPKKIKITLIVIVCVVALVILLCFFTSSKVFRASAYQQMLEVDENADFSKDIAEMSISQIPVVDRDVAENLGLREIGTVGELVSQFNVSSYYSQINYKNKPFRVSPLEYADFLKWMSNKDRGITHYVSIDMSKQEADLVKLDEGKGMKYSPSEYFTRDLKRHIRFAYPTKMFENLSFEIDDSGHPYWVMSYYTYTIGIVGGKDIAGIILVDAVSGEMTDYAVNEVPQWIDLAYSPELVIAQANNWGSLKGGFINSLFVQTGVVVTTEGYNYVADDDDVWLYTGITSVVADESNIGFILINMRTKAAKTYMISGAEEYSAMQSAEGQIQEKGYTATFPILLNIADRPTYFISLKDNAGLVKAYAFVSVTDYQIVGVGTSVEAANAEYLLKLGIDSSEDMGEISEFVGVVSDIATAVKDGNTLYYLIIDIDGVKSIYTADIRISDVLPFVAVGDKVKFDANDNGKIAKIEKIVEPNT